MTTPMNLQYPVPGVGGTTGPEWAQELNNNFAKIEAHDHTPNNGSPLVAASINIDADLSFNGHNAIDLRSARLVSYANAGLFAAGVTDKSCVFSVAGELYYRDQAGNSVQITSAGGVAGTPGSIGGLAAPAAVTWGAIAGNLVFYKDTGANTGMNLVSGGLSLVDPAAGGMAGNAIKIKAAPAPSAYNMVLPAAAPTTSQSLQFDSSGNASWVSDLGRMPIGSVIASFPNLTGAYNCTATTSADASGFVKCNGQTISDATSPMNGQVVPNINNDVFIKGNVTAGAAGGNTTSSQLSAATPLPDHAHFLDLQGGAKVNPDSGNGTMFGARTTAGNFNATGYYPGSIVGTSTLDSGVGLYGKTAGLSSASVTLNLAHSHTAVIPNFISALFIMLIK